MEMKTKSLSQWTSRRETPEKAPVRLGRPEVIPSAARIALRGCYEEHVHEWGPTVLACWAEREGLGKWSAETNDKVIYDLKPKREEKPRPDLGRYSKAGHPERSLSSRVSVSQAESNLESE
jgi:hypothetical protein